MKRKLLCLFFFLIVTMGIQGQTWAPAGAKWTFGVAYAFSPAIEYREWISTGDTLISGHNCKIIQRNGGVVAGDISDKLITYEDSDIIYWYNINQFTVLYDFNKNAGDTWITITDTCGLLITVDSTGIDTINGFPLKALYISSSDFAFNGKVLEHIGNIWRPNPDISYHCFNWVIDANYYTGLRCYEDSAFGFHSFNIAPSCDYNTGIDEIKNMLGLSFFPNPTLSELGINSFESEDNSELTIYNVLGEKRLTLFPVPGTPKDEGLRIDVSSLASGIYFVKAKTKKGTISARFVKE